MRISRAAQLHLKTERSDVILPPPLRIGLFTEVIRRRYSRARPNTPSVARCQFAMRAILFQLGAKIDIRTIAEEEVQATGWDRSEFEGASWD